MRSNDEKTILRASVDFKRLKRRLPDSHENQIEENGFIARFGATTMLYRHKGLHAC